MSNHKIPKTTGGRIYKLRRERKGEKYSQTDFAKDLNISKQLVQAWESDERPISKTSQIVSVADTLETSTDYLLCRAIDDRKVDDISPVDQIGLDSEASSFISHLATDFPPEYMTALNQLLLNPLFIPFLDCLARIIEIDRLIAQHDKEWKDLNSEANKFIKRIKPELDKYGYNVLTMQGERNSEIVRAEEFMKGLIPSISKGVV